MARREETLPMTDAILLVVAQEPGETIRGRTLLQKKLYFLSVLCELDYGFAPHFYGPYSSPISDEVGTLLAVGFLEQSSRSSNETLGRARDLRRYDYKLTPAGQEVVASYGERALPYAEALERINAHRISRDANLLSVAAKVHLIVQQLGTATADDIGRRARELGWDLSEKDVDAVAEFLTQLDLVETTETATAS